MKLHTRRSLLHLAGLSLLPLGTRAEAKPPSLPPPSLALALTAQPGNTLRLDQLAQFQLNFVVANLGHSVLDPQLATSVLLLDGAPVKNWDITINNGPRDGRWTALPPGDELRFGYAFGDSLFRTPGEHKFILKSGGATSPPLTVLVLR